MAVPDSNFRQEDNVQRGLTQRSGGRSISFTPSNSIAGNSLLDQQHLLQLLPENQLLLHQQQLLQQQRNLNPPQAPNRQKQTPILQHFEAVPRKVHPILVPDSSQFEDQQLNGFLSRQPVLDPTQSSPQLLFNHHPEKSLQKQNLNAQGQPLQIDQLLKGNLLELLGMDSMVKVEYMYLINLLCK